MTAAEASKRAKKNLLNRIGPSTMPIETKVFGSSVQAFDPESGSFVTFEIGEGRLRNARWRIKH